MAKLSEVLSASGNNATKDIILDTGDSDTGETLKNFFLGEVTGSDPNSGTNLDQLGRVMQHLATVFADMGSFIEAEKLMSICVSFR